MTGTEKTDRGCWKSERVNQPLTETGGVQRYHDNANSSNKAV